MEKLELKQIQSYPMGKDGVKILLPKHQLKYGEQDILPLNGVSIGTDGELQLEMLLPNNDLLFTTSEVDINRCKLVLHDLSDLTKEKLSEYYTQLMDADLDRCIKDTLEYPLNQSYTFTQYLLSKHYDIYHLIPKGLAVDTNTL